MAYERTVSQSVFDFLFNANQNYVRTSQKYNLVVSQAVAYL